MKFERPCPKMAPTLSSMHACKIHKTHSNFIFVIADLSIRKLDLHQC